MADWEQAQNETTTAETPSEIVISNYEFNFGQYLSSGWSIFASKMGGFVGFTLLLILINAVLAAIPLLGTIASIVINAPLAAGYYIVARKIMNNEETQFGDFFKGFDFLLPLFLASLISGIFISIGILLLILPGIYLAVGYMFTAQFVINRDMSFFDAMEASRKLITKQWFMFFIFSLVIGVINIVGIILLGVGVLFTIPFTVCALAVAYDDIVNKQLS